MQTSTIILPALPYLLGPRWLLAGIYPFFVMVEGFLLCWPLVLPLLLLLLLQGHQVVPLLLELPLQPLRLPLLLQLLALVLLPRRKHSHKVPGQMYLFGSAMGPEHLKGRFLAELSDLKGFGD